MQAPDASPVDDGQDYDEAFGGSVEYDVRAMFVAMHVCAYRGGEAPHLGLISQQAEDVIETIGIGLGLDGAELPAPEDEYVVELGG